MKMPLTYYERTEFTEHADEIVERIINDEKYSMLLFKVLALNIRNIDTIAYDWDETIFEDRSLFRSKLIELLQHAANEAFALSKQAAATAIIERPRPTVELRGYTSRDLAKFFGVSQTTINKWVKQGRFEGVSRTYEGENLYFSPATWFTSPNGKKYRISDIVAQYEEKHAADNSNSKNELAIAEEQIAYYTNKYKGKYEDTLGAKQDQWTPQEEMDAHTWKFYLKKLNVPRDSR
ncbi:MerR family transcriptional regulator [Paenibacillus alkalitolerans]|uniref:helix-turn-helix domain-containing protein n=1 Tax=Paenibacillus alkalitolerans TaxID=2799335 RepID=UPI0018F63D3D|nr:helix-turn-helix domain-containing protein [Paenibacillus alkalitolerans]